MPEDNKDTIADPKTIGEIESKMRLEGVVKSTEIFGVLVDVGVDHDGLLHISEIKSMPSKPISSIRPTNGEMNEAPTLASKIAWAAEKQSVTFTCVPRARRALHVLRPLTVRGTLIVTFFASEAKY